MIEVADVSRYFGDFCAVDNISFSIEKGEIVGLLGPNGAGKTTTMRMITGFLVPTSGSVSVDDMEVWQYPEKVKSRIGYLPEMAPFYGDMMVYDYLRYTAEMYNLKDPEEDIARVAEMCSLEGVMHKNIETLSRGYKQRVGLAFTLVHDPDILVLDEPTSGLDPNQIIEVRGLIKRIGLQKTVIISTHILPEVESLCDRVIIVNKGHVAADSPTDELAARFGSRVSLRIQAAGCSTGRLEDELKGIDGILEVHPVHDGEEGLAALLLSSDGTKDVRPEVFKAVTARGWILYEMTQKRNSLEDVFRGLTVEGPESGGAP